MADERIGVLLVHGIGTNTPNQFLVDQSRKIVAAIGEQVASISVLHEPPIGDKVPDKYVVDYGTNMVRVEVKTKAADPKDSRTLEIEFNEVYWADLGEKPTLINQAKFWFWALSMWALAARDYTRLPGFAGMYKPKGGRLRSWDRLILGAYGVLFLLGASTVGLLNIIADRLKLPRVPISDILTAYLGDVMLYSQTSGDDDPAVSDLALPPRVAIRARMVDALVDVAMRGYSRWYLLAHSQGTVVAYNGLMETAAALPNYLGEARWKAVQRAALAKQLKDPVTGLMLPRRPTWLNPDDAINRTALFAKLGGFLTYGAAIGKFHAIWPIIVPANAEEEEVFPESFSWINVFDPTDPVSGPLNAFTREHGHWSDGSRINRARYPTQVGPHPAAGHLVAAKIDHSIPYKAGPLWLMSHLQYLNYYSPGYQRQEPLLVNEVVRWLLGGAFDAKRLEEAAPSVWRRAIFNSLQVVAATAIVWLLAAALLWEIVGSKWLHWLDHVAWPVAALGAIVVAVLFNGGVQLFKAATGEDPRRWLRWIVFAVAVAGTVAVALRFEGAGRWFHHLLHDGAQAAAQYLRSFPWGVGDVMGWVIGLLHHPGAFKMSIGLLSFTIVTIVLFGWIRWLVQPLPVQQHEHEQGLRPPP